MYIRNLSTELAELWVRDLLISGWTSSAVVAAIRALDNPKPLERRKLIVRWSLPIPPAPDDPLIDENGDELLNEDGRRRRRGSATDHIAISANKAAAKREAARAAAIEKRMARSAERWRLYDAGAIPRPPSSPRPERFLAAA